MRRLTDVSASNCVVGIIHDRNTSRKTVRDVYWTPRPVGEVEDLLGGDIAFYSRRTETVPG